MKVTIVGAGNVGATCADVISYRGIASEVVLVDIKDTIRGFNEIMDGKHDNLPEAAFNLVGTIEDAVAKGQKMMAEAK